MPISAAGSLLNALGTQVATGERLGIGDCAVVGETEVTFGSVHRVHLAAGLVGAWTDVYRSEPAMLGRLEVLQVLPVPARRLPRLDQAHTTLRI